MEDMNVENINSTTAEAEQAIERRTVLPILRMSTLRWYEKPVLRTGSDRCFIKPEPTLCSMEYGLGVPSCTLLLHARTINPSSFHFGQAFCLMIAD